MKVVNTTYNLEKTFTITVRDDVPTPEAQLPSWDIPDNNHTRAFLNANSQAEPFVNLTATVHEYLWDSAQEDFITGNKNHNWIGGGVGNDVIKGRRGNDILLGDSGNDYLRGGRGDDVLIGGTDDDLLRGDRGDDLLFGGSGNDEFIMSWGNDVIADFVAGEDTIRGLYSNRVESFEDTEFGALITHNSGTSLVLGTSTADLGLF